VGVMWNSKDKINISNPSQIFKNDPSERKDIG
jgi:hypothetical protein